MKKQYAIRLDDDLTELHLRLNRGEEVIMAIPMGEDTVLVMQCEEDRDITFSLDWCIAELEGILEKSPGEPTVTQVLGGLRAARERFCG